MKKMIHNVLYATNHTLSIYRQNQTSNMTTPFALAQRYLPRELLQDLRMAPPSKSKRRRPLERVDEGEE